MNLKKGQELKVRLSWDDNTDLDLHALVAVNTGSGAKCLASATSCPPTPSSAC